jgi:vacuolar-type H+-ATPase subunit C/Vma6
VYEYGNARVAGMRSRLLDDAVLRRLEDASSAAAFMAALEQQADLRPFLHDVAPLAAPGPAIEAAIERHRAARLRVLPRFYEGRARRLVEALVVPLDRERVIGIVRRRRAGEPPEVVAESIVSGALLGPAQLGVLARIPGLVGVVRELGRLGLLDRSDAAALAGRLEAREEPARIEAALLDGMDRVRLAWTDGRHADQRLVRSMIEDEVRLRSEAVDELGQAGASAASLLERVSLLARLDALVAAAHRDPLGVGPVAGYVAGLEAQAIRVRAALAGVAAGWGRDLVGSYLAVGRS